MFRFCSWVIYTYRIERRSSGPQRPDYFVRRTGRRPYLEVIHAEVPPFVGEEAWFEVEKLPMKPLRIIREVERPAGL
jgi:hypothetical protein